VQLYTRIRLLCDRADTVVVDLVTRTYSEWTLLSQYPSLLLHLPSCRLSCRLPPLDSLDPFRLLHKSNVAIEMVVACNLGDVHMNRSPVFMIQSNFVLDIYIKSFAERNWTGGRPICGWMRGGTRKGKNYAMSSFGLSALINAQSLKSTLSRNVVSSKSGRQVSKKVHNEDFSIRLTQYIDR
jgi:hypothetical protein